MDINYDYVNRPITVLTIHNQRMFVIDAVKFVWCKPKLEKQLILNRNQSRVTAVFDTSPSIFCVQNIGHFSFAVTVIT